MTARAKHIKSQQPTSIRPMLATLVKEPFNDQSYVYEVKWDGYRIIAFCNNDKVRLQSRGGEDYTKKYPSIAESLRKMKLNCILDGEVVYINDKGKPDFDSLQRVNGQAARLIYYCFDLLWVDGDNIMARELLGRKSLLARLLKSNPVIKYSDHFEDGKQLFEQINSIGLEGIVAKQKTSPYLEDDRSKKWLKITTEHKQEFVIGGWVQSEKRNTFRTLLFGSYEEGKLKWKGHAGGGYKDHEMPSILKRLKEIEIKKNPFDSEVEYSEGVPHWVKPELVANIKFSTTTRAGRIRKPAIFLGFRNDKKSSEVQTEIAQPSPTSRTRTQAEKKEVAHGNNAIEKRFQPTSPDSNWPELEREPIRNQDEFEIDSCSITLYNVDRELWKGITKASLIEYYNGVSRYILPHLKDRALSLHVKYKGPNAPGLYIKDMEGRNPECASVFTTPRKHKKAGKREVIDYLVCNNTATLLYMVNLGCIDINPWTSTTSDSLHPDYIIIDLDPTDDDFTKAIDAARAAKQFFDEHKLKSFVKTSGKSGLHMFLPCMGFTFPQARTIAEAICKAVNGLVPSITTTEISVSGRGTKLYLDPNQNDYADTVASVYSVRPNRLPTVSAALDWREVKSGLLPEQFTINTIMKRLEKKGDLFASVLDKKPAVHNANILQKIMSGPFIK